MGKWDGITNPKILAAVREDKPLSHNQVVELLRALLDDARLTPSELSDFWIVARNADGMAPRSISMLWYLVEQAHKAAAADGLFSLTTAGERVAADHICDFLKGIGNGFFPNLNRDKVGIDLLMRVGNPGIMNQDHSGLCGPMAFLYGLASDTPLDYADFALELYEKGSSEIGDMRIEPSKGCRNYSPPNSMSPADWLTAASLRDSENWWFDVDDVDVGFSAGTTIGEIEKWFERAGYRDVESESNLVEGLDSSDINDLNRYYNEGRRIVLRVNSKMLHADTQSETTYRGNHVVVLHSLIARTSQGVRLTIFTWGHGEYTIPQGGPLSESDFLGNLYGYVAGKPY